MLLYFELHIYIHNINDGEAQIYTAFFAHIDLKRKGEIE